MHARFPVSLCVWKVQEGAAVVAVVQERVTPIEELPADWAIVRGTRDVRSTQGDTHELWGEAGGLGKEEEVSEETLWCGRKTRSAEKRERDRDVTAVGASKGRNT